MKSAIALRMRSVFAAFKAMVVLTVVIGVVYTGAVSLIGRFAFPEQAGGSLLTDSRGAVIGSIYIGQSFTDARGRALARYFQSRPSATANAAGEASPYDAADSSASNLGPFNAGQVALIGQRRIEVAKREHVRLSQVPADAVTASGSGLDYQISVAYADIQVNRVAKARGLSVDTVDSFVARCTAHRGLGFIGEEGVNVLELNAALDRLG
ncbi:MAG: K(+)-transporting ATPase subunit C [Bifidobacterium mongoliense]|jgi:K+-transporting ATPase ATPase C chain|uniref:K(+)-transporting ATPase subunit C n=1 Tax=Bifidobacterium mongoliense TaxID=518643 RepID=UPI002F3609EB